MVSPRRKSSPKRKTSPRRSHLRRPKKLVKGSAEAKAYMARVRAMRKTHKHHLKKSHRHKKRSVRAVSPRRKTRKSKK